jgi:hypothetical protein
LLLTCIAKIVYLVPRSLSAAPPFMASLILFIHFCQGFLQKRLDSLLTAIKALEVLAQESDQAGCHPRSTLSEAG